MLYFNFCVTIDSTSSLFANRVLAFRPVYKSEVIRMGGTLLSNDYYL